MATIVAVRRDSGQTVTGYHNAFEALSRHVRYFLPIRVRLSLFLAILIWGGRWVGLLRTGLPETKSKVGKLKKARAIGSTAGTVFPCPFAVRTFKGVAWSNPKIPGPVRFRWPPFSYAFWLLRHGN